jgi:hypothetical protein
MEKFIERRVEDSLRVSDYDQNRKEKIIVLENSPFAQFEALPGVSFQGTQYYDFKNVRYISHCGMAKMIEHIKSLLQEGTEIKFVNVNEAIIERIRSVGLDHVIHCN